MKKVIGILMLLHLTSLYSQLQGNYDTGESKFRIDTLSGMFNGKAILWGKDGKKRLEGQYKDNQKTGIWKAWDTLGRLRMRAEYQNSFRFGGLELYSADGKKLQRLSADAYSKKKQTDSIAKAKENAIWANADMMRMDSLRAEKAKPVPARESYGYEEYLLKKNTSGIFGYPHVSDSDVLMGTKIFRYIAPCRLNAPLFGEGMLSALRKHISLSGSPEIYTTSEFVMKLPPSETLSKIAKISEIAGYKLCEYHYFDQNVLGSSTRILGLCPVVFNPVTQRYDELFWIYYPSIRESFGSINITVKSSKDIKTLDDIFYFRHFNGFIYFREHVSEKEWDIDLYGDMEKLRAAGSKYEEHLLNSEWVVWPHYTK